MEKRRTENNPSPWFKTSNRRVSRRNSDLTSGSPSPSQSWPSSSFCPSPQSQNSPVANWSWTEGPAGNSLEPSGFSHPIYENGISRNVLEEPSLGSSSSTLNVRDQNQFQENFPADYLIPSILNFLKDVHIESDDFIPLHAHHEPSSVTTTTAARFFVEQPQFPILKIDPCSYLPEQTLGIKAHFFVQTLEHDENLPEIDSLIVEIKLPDGSTKLHDLNMLNPIKYLFSFVPQLSGFHVVKIVAVNGNQRRELKLAGGPHLVLVSRNYLKINDNSPNLLSLGFSPPVHGQNFLAKGWGVAIDHRTNNVYLTDRERHHIVVINSSGYVVNCFGQKGRGRGKFNRPTGIVIDATNCRIIISDKDGHRICVHSMDGKFLFSFGSKGHGNGQFCYPWGVACSPDGSLIAVADTRNYRVQFFDKHGKYLRKYSAYEVDPFEYAGQFNYPRGVAFDLSGKFLYVSDFNLQALFKIDCETMTKETVIPKYQLNRPQGLAVDPAGNILVCCSKSNSIHVIKANGTYCGLFKQSGKSLFISPFDVATFADGRIGIVEGGTRLRIF